MKKLIPITLAMLILASCTSSTKLMQKGRYDQSIDKAVKTLMKKPGSTKDAIALDKSFKLANDADLNRIKFLRQEGNPDSWNEVLGRYASLKSRQSRVHPVLPLNIHGRQVNYPFVDYDQEIIDAKGKAADYFYDNGKKLLKQETKEGYRQAYGELSRAKQYRTGQFPDIDNLIEEARYNGISRVILEINNMTQLRLHPDFIDNLLEMNTANLESQWVEYYLKDLDQSINYDYSVLVNLERIEVSPDNVSQSDKMYQKEIQDGYEYVLDKNGNVMKDTAGNDIKLSKYKTLSCTVIESVQHKEVIIEGTVEMQSLHPLKIIKKEPIGAKNIFEHRSARAVGDLDVLDEKTLRITKSEFLPFPTDGEMIFNCVETLRPAIREAIYRNRRYIY